MDTEDRLSTLLKQWKDVEPQADFDARVWRRIRAQPVPIVRRGFGSMAWRLWFVTPERVAPSAAKGPLARGDVALLAAVLAGILVGGWAGLQPFARFPGDSAGGAFHILQRGTLTGNYVQLLAQGETHE